MFARKCRRLLLLMLLCPSAAFALGLGDIHLKSSLDAPLSADIDVVDANADDLSTLKATLASRDTFTHFGADYPAFLGTVSFTPQRTADGHIVIHVSSSAVADEPFATLLVEADWARGHVVREYTVLLDPPTFTAQTATNAAVTAPSVDSAQRAGTIQPAPEAASVANAAPASGTSAGEAVAHGAGVAPSATPQAAGDAGAAPPGASEAANATQASAASAAASSEAPQAGGDNAPSGPPPAQAGTYTVQRGDTLSSITEQRYPSGTRAARDRALVAIYRANPHAFARNMNVLLAGRVLTLPGDSELVAIGPGEATAEVHAQYESWRSAQSVPGAGASAHGVAAAAGGTSGQLRLVAPQEAAQEAQQAAPLGAAGTPPGGIGSGTGTRTGAGSSSNAALQQRVQQLQAQLAQSQRLLQLRDAQLAAMQAQVAQANQTGRAVPAPTAPAPVAPAPAAPSSSAAVSPAAAPASPPVAALPPPLAAHVPAAVAPAALARKPVKRPVAAHPSARPAANAGNSTMDLVREYWYVPAALLAVLIALVVMKAVRTRQEDAFDRSLGRLSGGGPPLESSAPSKPRTDTLPVRTMPTAREEPSYRVEESGSHRQPVFDETVDANAATGQHVAIDEGVAAEEMPVALDQGDPLAEADFHMAYGLYDQAAELVQGAITREPQRRDLRLKLLEVFFVWGNKDRFLQSAHELAATREQAPAGEWEKIVIMGRQIAPEDSLFADGRGVAGAASGGVDLNLEGGQNRVDFDLLGEPTIGAPAAASGVDLDLSGALGAAQASPDADATGEAPGPAGSVDFVLDGEELGSNDATGTTRKMPGSGASVAATREMPAIPTARGIGDTEKVPIPTAAVAEAPTVEQPQLRRDEHATIRQKLDAATRHGMLAGEQTAELAIDDLGLDLGSLEARDARAVANDPNAPTMLAEMDQDTRRVFARADGARAEVARSDSGATQTAAAPAPAMRATGTWLFTDTDFATMAKGTPATQADATQRARTELITQIAAQPPIDTSSTSRLAALDAADLDLDLSALDSLKDQPSNGVDLDVGTASAGAAHQPDAAADGAASLPDLEPVTLSEVGTKLDLARAYMDMGDPEGARSILSEVLSEGSLSQKQEARRLMDALPG